MRTLKKNWPKLAGALALSSLVLCTVYACVSAWGQTAPGLSIALTGTNQVTITVTNGATNGVYEIWFTDVLDTNAQVFTNGSWVLLATGATNQTNFVFTLGDTDTGYFQALVGNDFDGDGVPDWKDARPFDPTIGILTVTIETPANGSVIQ